MKVTAVGRLLIGVLSRRGCFPTSAPNMGQRQYYVTREKEAVVGGKKDTFGSALLD